MLSIELGETKAANSKSQTKNKCGKYQLNMFTLTIRSTTVHVEEISSNAGPRLRSRLFCLCSMSLNFNRGPTSHDASQKKKEEKKENREKNMVPH